MNGQRVLVGQQAITIVQLSRQTRISCVCYKCLCVHLQRQEEDIVLCSAILCLIPMRRVSQ